MSELGLKWFLGVAVIFVDLDVRWEAKRCSQ
jgi:hypothetical protein